MYGYRCVWFPFEVVLLATPATSEAKLATLHFLNVREGDCSLIQHNSGRVSVIDECNAQIVDVVEDRGLMLMAKAERGVAGNFQQKKYPVNPISYMSDHGISSVFRYVQTHPDMDHMDGIKALFGEFCPINFWDTDNNKEMARPWDSPRYREEDWNFYKHLRDTSPTTDPKRLTLLSGVTGQYYNRNEDGSGGGDGLHVLSPTQTLVDRANDSSGDYHDASYVLLYSTGGSRIVFGGDSHDLTWDHILEKHAEDVTDIDLFIAPHHGRKSGRSYRFLDMLTPTLTFFGNAPHEHLAYDAWNRRGLQKITNNQANCMVVDASSSPMELYVTHENFARRVNADTFYDQTRRAWSVGPITADLLG